MIQLLWDASALAKRYVPEVGSQSTDVLWTTPNRSMIGTFVGYAEVNWILLRKRNRREIGALSFTAAKSSLRLEVADSLEFHLLEIETLDILAGITLTEKYNIGPSDAMILAAYLRYALIVGETCVLVAADVRFLKAAASESLKTLNPEHLAAVDVPAFLAALK